MPTEPPVITETRESVRNLNWKGIHHLPEAEGDKVSPAIFKGLMAAIPPGVVRQKACGQHLSRLCPPSKEAEHVTMYATQLAVEK